MESVCAFADLASHRRIEVEDNAVAIVKFQSGALGVIEGSTACYARSGNPIEVHMCGAGGTIFMQDNSFTVWDFKEGRSNDKKILASLGAKPDKNGEGAADPAAMSYKQHQLCFEDMVRAIKKGVPPMVDGPEARKSLEIVLANYRSALAGGKPVTLLLVCTPARRPFFS